MGTEQFRKLRWTSPTGFAEFGDLPPQIAAERAALLFGCYRGGDANDPVTYSTAVTAVLTCFPEHVVEYVTDPRTGIPSAEQWLPSVAVVKRACIVRQSYLERLADFDRRFGNRRPATVLPAFDKTRPGRPANVFVHTTRRISALIGGASKTADPADWKFDERGRAGLWVASGLI